MEPFKIKGGIMRFIQKIAYKGAFDISLELNKSHKMKYRYYHGLQAILNQIAEFLVILIVAMIFNILPQVFLISVVFAVLRYFVGGMHLSSLTLCTMFTVFLNNAAGILAKSMAPSSVCLLSSFAIITLSIILWAPKSKKYDLGMRHKRKIQGLVISWVFFMGALLSGGVFMNSTAFGFILIAYTISPLAEIMLSPIDKKLKRLIK